MKKSEFDRLCDLYRTAVQELNEPKLDISEVAAAISKLSASNVSEGWRPNNTLSVNVASRLQTGLLLEKNVTHRESEDLIPMLQPKFPRISFIYNNKRSCIETDNDVLQNSLFQEYQPLFAAVEHFCFGFRSEIQKLIPTLADNGCEVFRPNILLMHERKLDANLLLNIFQNLVINDGWSIGGAAFVNIAERRGMVETRFDFNLFTNITSF